VVPVPRIAANPNKVASLSPYSVRKMIGKLAPSSELVSVWPEVLSAVASNPSLKQKKNRTLPHEEQRYERLRLITLLVSAACVGRSVRVIHLISNFRSQRTIAVSPGAPGRGTRSSILKEPIVEAVPCVRVSLDVSLAFGVPWTVCTVARQGLRANARLGLERSEIGRRLWRKPFYFSLLTGQTTGRVKRSGQVLVETADAGSLITVE
jgi:hypothetical protein